MGSIDANFVVNTALAVFLATYLLVNGFLIYLLVRLRNTLQNISTWSKELGSISPGITEVHELRTSLIEIHRVSAQELNEIDELKQSLFDIQNTTARQLNEISKLKQSLAGIAPGATPPIARTHSRVVP